MVNTQPQNNAAMLAYGSPQPQHTAAVGGFQPQGTAVAGGFQPQSPVVMGTMQPQSPVPMGNMQPYNPVAMGGIQPQSPVMMNPGQLQSPVMMSPGQPQSPIMMTPGQPQSPVMMSPGQPQSPVVMYPVQPQAVAPMQIHGKVYGDHGANHRPVGPDGKRDWAYGLMDCFGRFGLCCWATWCPCVVYSKTRQRLRSLQYQGRPLAGGGDTYSDHCCIYTALLCIGHPWIMQVQPRAEIRERYAIRGNIINDWLASFCCNACALTQERREVEVEEASFQAVQQVVQVDEK